MSKEIEAKAWSGWLMLVVEVVLVGAAALLVWHNVEGPPAAIWIVPVVVLGILAALVACGFFIIEPNGSKVMLLFGSYKGTVKQSGFQWMNPFLTKRAVSRVSCGTSWSRVIQQGSQFNIRPPATESSPSQRWEGRGTSPRRGPQPGSIRNLKRVLLPAGGGSQVP